MSDFRAETRAWLEENCPTAMRSFMPENEQVAGGKQAEYVRPEQKIWLDRMAEKGWTAPAWPKQYGGGGLTNEQAMILEEEMQDLGCRVPLRGMGLSMLGPVLLEYGTEEQRQTHIPPIVRGEIRWCQGYSEPGAGSDLASLATRAEDKGDHFLVNGQKVWTSYANYADWIFCLVRTDANAKKHEGISFLLFDMASPGVTTRPILLISGKSPFCETFFSDVKVPKENLVGVRNKGWDVAKYLLTHERDMIGGMGLGGVGRPLGQIAADSIGVENGALADPLLRADIADFDVDAWAFQFAMERAGDLAKAKQAHPAFSSFLKYYGTELNKRRHELIMSSLGADGLEWESARSTEGEAPRAWLRTKANSIEGGTSEVQLNIISKRILDLPGA